jgi:hypothetical protein
MSVLSGMNAHLPTKADIDKVVELHMQWIRVDINWHQIEGHEGECDWDLWDEAINYSKEKGLKIYGTLSHAPYWCGPEINSVPNPVAWEKFVKEVANRYGKKIDVYSLWNEPNLKQFWQGSLLQYIDIILIPASAILRGKGLTIAVPDLSTHGDNWTKWLDAMIEYQHYYDILSIHTYEKSVGEVEKAFSKGQWGFLQRFHEPWKPYNYWLDRILLPTWLTEVGWRSDKIGENQQASIYLELATKGVPSAAVVIAYELRDDSFSVQKWGILASNGEEKPAAMLVKNV